MKPKNPQFSALISTAELDGLVRQFGVVFQRFGLRQSLGRIWAVLYLSPEPVNQADLAQLLGLSSGLISASLRELQKWSAIRTVSISGSRRTHYVAEHNLLRMLTTILAKREMDAIRELQVAIRQANARCQQTSRANDMQERLQAVEESAELYATLASLVPRLARLPVRGIKRAVRLLRAIRPADELSDAPTTSGGLRL